MQLAQLVKSSITKAYNYLFTYDEDKLTIYGQKEKELIDALDSAFTHRKFVLITYENSQNDIGIIIKKISAARYILKTQASNGKILKIIDISEIFRTDLA